MISIRVPRFARLAKRSLALRLRLGWITREWRNLTRGDQQLPNGRQSIIVIPSDMRTLVGSRGDQAMTSVVASYLQTKHSNARRYMLVQTDAAADTAKRLGFEVIHLAESPALTFRRIMDAQPAAAAIVGADVMDGQYGVEKSLVRYVLADLLARQGIPVTVLGFSISERPDPRLLGAMLALHADVTLCLRDPVAG